MSYPPLRVEIKPANREKLEIAAQELKMSPNELVNQLVDSMLAMEMVQHITVKLQGGVVIRRIKTIGRFQR